MHDPVAAEQAGGIVVEQERRHKWMILCSVITAGLGVAALGGGSLGPVLLGLAILGVVGFAAKVSGFWAQVDSLTGGQKCLVWGVAIVGGLAGSAFIAMVWLSFKIIGFGFQLLGVDFGSGEPGIGTAIFRSLHKQRQVGPGHWHSISSRNAALVNRIASAQWVGDKRVTHDGGFTYIGDDLVRSDGTYVYVGNDRVRSEGQFLYIGDKMVTREGGSLYVDGQRVQE